MVSGSEREVLKIIRDEGGETNLRLLAHKLGSPWGLDYVRLICNSLGRADYIDVLSSGKLRITAKGKAAVEGK